MIALTYQIYELTNSAVWVSGVFLATFAAMGILTPIGGWLGDTYDRRMVMIVSDLASAVVFVALVFADKPWMLIALALLATVAEMPFLPASQAAIPNLASDEDLAWANGLVSQAFSLGITVGPLIGGVLVGAVGTGAAFGINAVSFLGSAALVWSVRGRFQERRAKGSNAIDVPFTEGLRVVFRTRILLTVVIAEVVATASFVVGLATAGPVIEAVGVRVAYVLAGVVFIVGALVLIPALRHRTEGILSDDLPSA